MSTTEEALRSAFESVRFDHELDDILHKAQKVRQRRTGFRVASVAGSLLVVLAIAVFVRVPEASAYWAAIPSTPEPALVAAAPKLCEMQLQVDLPPLVLVDQRADAARAVFGVNTDSSSSMHLCTLIREGETWSAPPIDDLPIPGYTMIGAVFDPDVVKVVIDQIDGIRVEAALSDGFFHFWWPDQESFPGGTQRFLNAEGGEELDSYEVPNS
jgi:hypothetical protein